MILLDATAFALLVNPDAEPPIDPKTGAPVHRASARFAYLEVTMRQKQELIVVPTPALAEVLVKLGDAGPAVLERISRSGKFRIAPFDTIAAVELALMTREALEAGDKKGGSDDPWQKIKIDRQIVAIARVHGVTRILSDDRTLGNFADRVGMKVTRTWELDAPPEDPQADLFTAPSHSPE